MDLREKDESTKKFWLVILSAVSMLVVVSLWFFYLKLAVFSPLSREKVDSPTQFSNTLESGVGEIFKKGAAVLDAFKNTVQSVTEQVNSTVITE